MRVLNLLVPMLLLLWPCAAAAEPPDLPAEALGDDVVGVLWIDAQQVDPGRLASGIDLTMGRYARAANEGLAPYTRLYAPFRRAGGTSVAIIYFDPFSANAAARGVANPVFLFSMGQDASEPALQSVIEQASLGESGKSTAKFEKIGGWLMAYDGTLARPWMEKGDKDRTELFRTALRPIARHPGVIAFVPTKRMRAAHAERFGLEPDTPKDLTLFIRTLLECKSLSITATLGQQPKVEAMVRMPDAETATQMISLTKPMLETLGGFLKKRDMRGTKIELITQIASYYAVFSNNTMQQDGNQITAAATDRRITATAEGVGDGILMAREEAVVVRSLNQMQALIVALNSYAQDNRGQYPIRLSDLRNQAYVKDFDKLITNPRTGENPGYVYVRPAQSFGDLVRKKRTASTPLLYEAKNGRIDPNGLIGYANAHVERADLSR